MDKDTSLLLTHHIKPDYGFYIQGDDRLFVAAYSSVSSLTVRFSGYFLSHNGEVRQYAVDVFPTNDRAATTALQFLGDGFILSCTAHLLSGSANRGQCYVRSRIQRGTGATIVPIAGIISGYLSDDYSPAWPFGKREGPLEGPGMLRSITGSDPAANAEISETVPTGARWRLISMRAVFVSDANITSRRVAFVEDDGTNNFLQLRAEADQTASLTGTYTFASNGNSSFGTNVVQHITTPIMGMLPAGARIRTITVNIQTTDNWGPPQLLVEEWIEA